MQFFFQKGCKRYEVQQEKSKGSKEYQKYKVDKNKIASESFRLRFWDWYWKLPELSRKKFLDILARRNINICEFISKAVEYIKKAPVTFLNITNFSIEIGEIRFYIYAVYNKRIEFESTRTKTFHKEQLSVIEEASLAIWSVPKSYLNSYFQLVYYSVNQTKSICINTTEVFNQNL